MGSSSSKVSRKFPTRAAPTPGKVYRPVKDLGSYQLDNPPSGAARNRPTPEIQEERTQSIEADGKDPHLLAMLRKAGPVKYTPKEPEPTVQTADPMADIFSARKKYATNSFVEEDSTAPRKFIEVSELIAILDARKQDVAEEDIQRQYNLHGTVLSRLGREVTTPTITGESDDYGNRKATWTSPTPT